MKTYYVRMYPMRGYEILDAPSPLIRVTKNRLGREVREWVGWPSGGPPAHPARHPHYEAERKAWLP